MSLGVWCFNRRFFFISVIQSLKLVVRFGTQEIEGTWQEYLIVCRSNGIHGDDRSYRIVPGSNGQSGERVCAQQQ